MRARLTKLLAGLTAVSALAFGGAALAGAASTPGPPAPPPASAPADTAQQGDQTAPDKAGATENAPEAASSEKADAPEPAESTSESATESASEVPGNDGPRGPPPHPRHRGSWRHSPSDLRRRRSRDLALGQAPVDCHAGSRAPAPPAGRSSRCFSTQRLASTSRRKPAAMRGATSRKTPFACISIREVSRARPEPTGSTM